MQGKNWLEAVVIPLVNVLPFFAERRAIQQAHQWTLRLDRPTQADNDAFMDWLTASPRHVSAYLKLTAVTEQFARKIESGEFDDELAAVEPAAAQGHIERMWRRYAIAAAVLIPLTVGAVLRERFFQAPPSPAVAAIEPYSAELASGERPIPYFLPDGSRLDLNRHSRVRVFFDQHSRGIALLSGELKAHVIHDEQRPFSVQAEGTRVTATGTDFSVRVLERDLTDIGVKEGAVKVERLVAAGPNRQGFESVKAGEVALSGPQGFVRREINAKKLKQRMAFQTAASRLEFRDTPLEEVISTFNSFNAVQLRVAAGSDLDVSLIGVFDASDLQGLIQALSYMHIHASGPDQRGVIELSRQE